MKNLNDELLLRSYNEAIKLNLDRDFIRALEEEIKRRGLPIVNNLTNFLKII